MPPYKEEPQTELVERLKAQADPRIFGNGQVFEEYPNATRWANYYEKYMAGEIETAPWILESGIERTSP